MNKPIISEPENLTGKNSRIEDLKREIQKGQKAVEEGRYTVIKNPGEMRSFIDRIKKKGQEKLKI